MEFKLCTGLRDLSHFSVQLRKAVVRLFQVWSRSNCFLPGRDGFRKVLLLQIENTQLQIGETKLWIEMDRRLQKRLHLIDVFDLGLLRRFPTFLKAHSV